MVNRTSIRGVVMLEVPVHLLTRYYTGKNNTVNSLPQFCPPAAECQIARLGRHVCAVDDINIGMGPFEPVICQAGYYCPPEKEGKETFKCPAGTYCQPGAATPTPCNIGSICPEGSTSQRYMIPMAVLIAVDVLLAIGIVLFSLRRKGMGRKKKSTNKREQSYEHKPKLDLKTFTATVTGYKQLDDETTKLEPSHEMGTYGGYYRDGGDLGETGYGGAAAATTIPGTDGTTITYMPDGAQHNVWAGMESMLKAPLSVESKRGSLAASVEAGLTPEIRAFVDSMRRATDATDIGLSFGYNKLTYQPKGVPRPILQNVTGSIKRGTLTAVMGGSGAGKSTFVNVLMGKTQYTSGSVTINQIPGKMKRYKKLIGYVPQDDIVLPELTVYENILHSARIRLPRTWREGEIRAHVDSVIDCLELSHVRDSRVGTISKPIISGGERKRVSIGMELAAAPMALFLDEPTSGLDATAANSMMITLKALARLGMSVIVIIHQPRMEIFSMLDDLILLADGQLIYEGPETEVQNFFEEIGYSFPQHANFGDVVTDIITGNGRPYKAAGDVSKESLIAYWAQHEPANVENQEDDIDTHSNLYPQDRERSESPTPSMQTVNTVVSTVSRIRHERHPSLRGEQQQPPSVGSVQINQLLRRRGAPLWKQTVLCLNRALLQQYRQRSSFWFEMGLATLAGFLLGLAEHSKKGILFTGLYNPPYDILSISSDFKSAPEMALLVAIAIGLVSAAPGVRIFSEELVLHRREAEAGHSRVAYFVAKTLSVFPRMVLACMHFTVPLFLLATPVMPWATAFLAHLVYFYCIYGLAALVSMLARREDAPLWATMLALIVGILSGAAPPLANVKGWHMEWLWRASPGVWLAEIYFGQLVKPFGYLYDVGLAARFTGYRLENGLWLDLVVLLAIGSLYRVFAFVGLLVGGRMRM